MLQQIFHDKEDHECQGNQNQPRYGKLPHDKEDKEDRECRGSQNQKGHGKLLCGGGRSRRRFFWPDQYFSDLWGANDFNPMLTFSSDFSELESAFSTQ
jgi:hypothetical protein